MGSEDSHLTPAFDMNLERHFKRGWQPFLRDLRRDHVSLLTQVSEQWLGRDRVWFFAVAHRMDGLFGCVRRMQE